MGKHAVSLSGRPRPFKVIAAEFGGGVLATAVPLVSKLPSRGELFELFEP
jgi:hypothetical protein